MRFRVHGQQIYYYAIYIVMSNYGLEPCTPDITITFVTLYITTGNRITGLEYSKLWITKLE